MKNFFKLFSICFCLQLCYVSSQILPLFLNGGKNMIPPFHNMVHNLESRSDTKDFVTGSDDVGDKLILTKYIEEGKLKEARDAAAVPKDYLLKNIDSYSGYFTVNKKYNGNLFFWYFPVMGKKVEETPLLVWLQGGPGVPGSFGLFEEIGPLHVSGDNKLQEIAYSWGKNHSLLFIDNPIGTGFSFVDDGGYTTNQTTIGENLYDGLQQFFTIFSELRKAPMILIGEGYGGKHVPSLAMQIHRIKNKVKNSSINLQGLAIGNGIMDPRSLLVHSYFANEAGLIDDNTAEKLRQIEMSAVKHIDEGQTKLALDEMLNIIAYITLNKTISDFNFLADNFPKNYLKLLMSKEVRKSIHVGNAMYEVHNLKVFDELSTDYMRSVKTWVEELIQNYKVMCYNGQLDIVAGYHPSVNSYSQLQYPGSDQYKTAKRSNWFHGNRLAGFVKTVGNFSDVMVRGAGHMVPIDQPAAALGMITAFARGIALTNNTGNLSPV